MTQHMHAVIAMALSIITWHGLIKHHPVMQEEIRNGEDWLWKKLFE